MSTSEAKTDEPVSIPPVLDQVARRECAAILKVIRESYRPSEAIETILVAGFISGARWAFERTGAPS
jgi:hypothetical protein